MINQHDFYINSYIILFLLCTNHNKSCNLIKLWKNLWPIVKKNMRLHIYYTKWQNTTWMGTHEILFLRWKERTVIEESLDVLKFKKSLKNTNYILNYIQNWKEKNTEKGDANYTHPQGPQPPLFGSQKVW